MEADGNKYQIMNQIQLSLLKIWVIKYLFGLKVPLIRNFKFLKRPQNKNDSEIVKNTMFGDFLSQTMIIKGFCT